MQAPKPEPPLRSPNSATPQRPEVRGKALFVGTCKLYVKGVTYGTFAPRDGDDGYPRPHMVRSDIEAMAANGINALRTYTVPPRWLLDLAWRHGVRVMVGIPWEGHVAFLDEGRESSIVERVRTGVQMCRGHPAVLCYVIGNEIPASIVRWHGSRRIERFLYRLYRAAKDEDPAGLVTYANYPSTEYLQLPFLDFACFNLFLESEEGFSAYLQRLQNLANERPLLLTETGLDSARHGQDAQAGTLAWQVRVAFASGAAGVFVFAWTDEWHRGGFDVTDWDFGLVDRQRKPKPALAAVGQVLREVPFPRAQEWPRITVVVCTHNGERTLGACLDNLTALDYPDFEVVVVDDGSSDATRTIADGYGFLVISTENRGLAAARNVGLEAATGELIAYIDDDAWPDPHWLVHLASTFEEESYAAVGGPNIPPPDDGKVAQCVARAPGGPVHVLLSDCVAEHIPGCNMAFRKQALEAVGGFDPRFRIAGDDVDICWRVQQHGWTIGFSPGAVVWHRRRGSVRAYLRQQYGYGKAEALLERKWPERYNPAGHLTWSGRIYGDGRRQHGGRRCRIYYGRWGTGLFQSADQRPPGLLASLPLLPEWYLVIAALAALSALGTLWAPLFAALPLAIASSAALIVDAAVAARRTCLPVFAQRGRCSPRFLILTATLHALQPLARLTGRLRNGLAPWRRAFIFSPRLPRPRNNRIWSESWRSQEEWLGAIEACLGAAGRAPLSAGPWDRWELEVRGGLLGGVRLRASVEEHGHGRQLFRIRSWPRCSKGAAALAVAFVLLTLASALNGAASAATVLLAVIAMTIAGSIAYQCACATGALLSALEHVVRMSGPPIDAVERKRALLPLAPSASEPPARTGEPEVRTVVQTLSAANRRNGAARLGVDDNGSPEAIHEKDLPR